MQLSNIVILNYHKISSKTDIGLTARHPLDFKNDLKLFRELGFQTITFADLLNENSELPAKPLIITFDDGYKSVVETALPLMQDFAFKGVVYMPTNYVGKTNDWDVQLGRKKFQHLTADDLKRLVSAGFEIGSHGASHRSFKSMSEEQCVAELQISKKTIEQIVQRPVLSLSYPFGQFDWQILKLSRQVGYRFGVSSIYYKNVRLLDGLSPLALRRFNVYRTDSAPVIKEKLKGNFNSFYAYRDWLIQRGSNATILWQRLFKQRN